MTKLPIHYIEYDSNFQLVVATVKGIMKHPFQLALATVKRVFALIARFQQTPPIHIYIYIS